MEENLLKKDPTVFLSILPPIRLTFPNPTWDPFKIPKQTLPKFCKSEKELVKIS